MGVTMHEGLYGAIQYCPDLDRAEGVNVGVYLVCVTTGQSLVRMSDSRDRLHLQRRLGSKRIDEKRIELAKTALTNRFVTSRIRSREDIEHFASREANNLIIMPPRRILITDIAKDIAELFDALVAEKQVKRIAKPSTPRLASVFEPLRESVPLWSNLKIRVPVLNKRLSADYAYKNNVVNYIKAVGFSQNKDQALKTASSVGLQGLFLSKHQFESVNQQLIVVARFAEPRAEEQVGEMMRDCNVRMILERDAKSLAEEVRAHAKPWHGRFPVWA